MRIILTFLFSLCCLIDTNGATITFKVKRPALVQLHKSIRSVAIIDRTVATNKKADVIEGILTGEGFTGNEKAIQSAMSGLAEQLKYSGRFHVVHTTDKLSGASFAGQFPNALDWETIENLCEKYNIDAIIALERFDSDYTVTNGQRAGEAIGVIASGLAQVDLSFRVYDPIEKSIADQHHFSYSDRFSSTSVSIQDAVAGLMNRSNAVSNIAHNAGINYASRITPSWIKISREYYKKSKGDHDMARGARMMESNDWEEALISLKKALKDGHRKTKGKAAHNIAVVYEILGDLKTAKEWATKAWGDFENKGSKNYAYKIKRRMG